MTCGLFVGILDDGRVPAFKRGSGSIAEVVRKLCSFFQRKGSNRNYLPVQIESWPDRRDLERGIPMFRKGYHLRGACPPYHLRTKKRDCWSKRDHRHLPLSRLGEYGRCARSRTRNSEVNQAILIEVTQRHCIRAGLDALVDIGSGMSHSHCRAGRKRCYRSD